MPGVYRSSINLIRWRGAVPNALNAGRVESFFGAGAIADVQAGVARETSVQAVNTNVNTVNNTLASYMPYLPQIDGRVLTILNNGAQQTTLAATQGTVNGIAANGAQQSTLNGVVTGVNNIYAALTSPGVIVQPNSYVITKTLQRGDLVINAPGTTGNSVIAAVTPTKARVDNGGGACLSQSLIPAQQASHKLWLISATLLQAERGYTESNDNIRWEVEEKP